MFGLKIYLNYLACQNEALQNFVMNSILSLLRPNVHLY